MPRTECAEDRIRRMQEAICHPKGDALSARAACGERFNPAFFLSMRKKAPLTVERKNGKGGISIFPLCNPP